MKQLKGKKHVNVDYIKFPIFKLTLWIHNVSFSERQTCGVAWHVSDSFLVCKSATISRVAALLLLYCRRGVACLMVFVVRKLTTMSWVAALLLVLKLATRGRSCQHPTSSSPLHPSQTKP